MLCAKNWHLSIILNNKGMKIKLLDKDNVRLISGLYDMFMFHIIAPSKNVSSNQTLVKRSKTAENACISLLNIYHCLFGRATTRSLGLVTH